MQTSQVVISSSIRRLLIVRQTVGFHEPYGRACAVERGTGAATLLADDAR